MGKDSVLLNKSKDFAIYIIEIYKHLVNDKKEFVLSKQLFRSGTAIGANLAEAVYGISKKDFLSKIYISLKECAETKYWIELLFKTDYISESEFNTLDSYCTELLKMLISTSKTTYSHINNLS